MKKRLLVLVGFSILSFMLKPYNLQGNRIRNPLTLPSQTDIRGDQDIQPVKIKVNNNWKSSFSKLSMEEKVKVCKRTCKDTHYHEEFTGVSYTANENNVLTLRDTRKIDEVYLGAYQVEYDKEFTEEKGCSYCMCAKGKEHRFKKAVYFADPYGNGSEQ
jgi:hypothetical protein